MNIFNDDGKKNSWVLIVAGRYYLGSTINAFHVMLQGHWYCYIAHFSNVNNSTEANISKYKEQNQLWNVIFKGTIV